MKVSLQVCGLGLHGPESLAPGFLQIGAGFPPLHTWSPEEDRVSMASGKETGALQSTQRSLLIALEVPLRRARGLGLLPSKMP